MTSEKSNSELLPCPFCGGPARTFRYNGTAQASCAALHTECAGTDVIAPVAMWNSRALASRHQEPVNEPAEGDKTSFGVDEAEAQVRAMLFGENSDEPGEWQVSETLKDAGGTLAWAARKFRDFGNKDHASACDLMAGRCAEARAHRAASIPKVEPAPEAERGHWAGEARRLLKSGQDALDALEAAEAERDALRKALEGCWCPRPANNRPDHFTVGECVAAGECGCCDGAPLMPRQALSRSKEK